MGTNKISASLRKIIATIASHKSALSKAPTAIQESLQAFRKDYPESKQTAFVMMSFEDSPQKKKIWKAIEEALKAKNIKALRADMTIYHNELYYNVLTYIHGCTFGIAVFERITSDITNPNVILKLGMQSRLENKFAYLRIRLLPIFPQTFLGDFMKSSIPITLLTQSPWCSKNGLRINTLMTIVCMSLN